MPYKLSPSSLSQFLRCPRCFWFYQNEGVKQPKSSFNPSLPSGMDYVIKKYFDNCRKQGKTPPEINSLDDVVLFDDEELLKKWRDTSEGLKLKDKNKNTLMGAVDDVLKKQYENGKEKLIILDYKTKGFKLKKDDYKWYQHQLDIYTFLLQQNGYETEDFACLLYYRPKKVTENGLVFFYTDLVKVNVSVDDAKSLFENAILVLEEKNPPLSKGCTYCENA